MKYLKFFGIFILALTIFFIVFYFWARRPLYSEDTYSAILDLVPDKESHIPDTFSVVTYNIGYLSGMTNNLPVDMPRELIESNFLKATNLLRNVNPDIIVFQEIDFKSSRTYDINQHKELAQNAGYGQGAVVVNWDKQYVPFPYWPIKHHFGRMLSGQAILSRSEILSNRRIVLPKPESNPFYYNDFYLDRLAQLSWLRTENDSLLVINVHFEAWDAPTREQQANIVLDIYRKYENEHPIILLGDFNCTPPFADNAFDEITIELLIVQPGLEMVTNKEDCLTYPKKHLTFTSETPEVKIDYIFYNSRFLECLDSKVLHEAGDISDHLPVWASFSLKK